MAKVFVEICGGVIQQVYSDISDIEVVKIDWDATENPGEEVQISEFWTARTRLMPDETRAAVAEFYAATPA
jgi:hypothetical protein